MALRVLKRLPRKIKQTPLAVGVALLLSLGSSAQVFAIKLSGNPASVALTEGGSRVISITLDEPIIGPGPDPAFLTIAVSSSNSSRLTTSTETVSYSESDWFQHKTFTLSAVDDQIHNGDTTVTVTMTVTSDSEYYNHFVGSVVVSIVDNDVAAPVLPPAVAFNATVAKLAETGQPAGVSILFGSLIIGIGLLIGRVKIKQPSKQ